MKSLTLMGRRILCIACIVVCMALFYVLNEIPLRTAIWVMGISLYTVFVLLLGIWLRPFNKE